MAGVKRLRDTFEAGSELRLGPADRPWRRLSGSQHGSAAPEDLLERKEFEDLTRVRESIIVGISSDAGE